MTPLKKAGLWALVGILAAALSPAAMGLGYMLTALMPIVAPLAMLAGLVAALYFLFKNGSSS